MTTQLRTDITNAFDAARERIKMHTPESPDLLQAVTRLIDESARFVEPNTEIQEARRAVLREVERTALLIQQASQLNQPAITAACADAANALAGLKAAIFEHGRA